MNDFFRRCSTCKAPIAYGADYYKCSVSTCNHSRLALFFCSVPCWDAHVPGARHRDAWAEKETAPKSQAADVGGTEAPLAADAKRRVVSSAAAPASANAGAPAAPSSTDDDDDVLVVVSKLKKYITTRSQMNTSSGVVGPLSNHLRRVCDAAVAEAAKEGRKTVLERDVVEAIRRFGRA